MQWYDWWVCCQVEDGQWKELLYSLVGDEPDLENDWYSLFTPLWRGISIALQTDDDPTIDSLIAQLVEKKVINTDNNGGALSHARTMIFAIVGWQTMLYRPELGTCPPLELAIADELDGYQGMARITLKQMQSMCERPLYELLMGFGLLLPRFNFHSCGAEEDQDVFEKWKTIDSQTCNAFLLTSIGRVTIKWVDSLCCHLEFDHASNTLYLFRYPSFCVTNIIRRESDKCHKSVLHACAVADYGGRQWATADEVTHMLHETVISYRLLFGQNKQARKLFRKLDPFHGVPEPQRDELLTELCGRKRCPKINEREVYDLAHDFPVLRCRLVVLQRCLDVQKPRTWKELWQDKRNSAQWFTFWAVLILGGVGIFLTFLQVILQVVQIALQQNTPSPAT